MSGCESYLEIDWEVEEVVLVLVILVDLRQKHFLSILVRDILDHDSCLVILLVKDGVKVKFEVISF